MKKTKLTRSLLAACSIVALSAVMYGCAHSSGPSQDELDAALADKATAEADAAAAAEAKTTAEADAADAADAQAAAEADAADAADAQAAAEADAADAADAQAAAEADAADAADAQAAAEADADDARLAQAAAETQAELDAAAAAAATDAEAKAKAAEEKAAADLAKKEADEKAGKLTALFNGLLRPNAADAINPDLFEVATTVPGILASHGMLATIIAPAAAVPGGDAAFAIHTPTALDSLGDWSGTDMLATNPAGIVDHVNVYTDINVGSELTFAMLFPQATVPAQYEEQLRIVTDAGLNARQGLISAVMENDDGEMVNVFQTGSGTRTHGTALAGEVFEIAGTFAGATGTYRCSEGTTNTNCISTGTNLGTRFSGNADITPTDDGDWSFNPDAGQMASVPDGRFNHFGWWLRIDTTGYHVVPFHASTEGPADVAVTLAGSATYSGKAAGKATINPQLPGELLIGGAFTADATLTANFEAPGPAAVGGAADGNAGALSGMIDNFVVDGEETDWTVALRSALITGAGTQRQVVDSGAGQTVWFIDGVGSSSVGSWVASFWNPNAADSTPDSVTGMLSATYNNTVGRMEGAFGANRE